MKTAGTVETDARAELHEAEELLSRRALGEALVGFNRAEAAGADRDRCSGGRWTTYMLLGKFERAWQESDTIRLRGAPDPNRFWTGEEISDRRVIVRCLHGFGDSVQFLRYAGHLNALASRVVWEVAPAMLEITRCFRGVSEALPWACDCEASRDWDIQIEVMELPYLFRTTQAELPIAGQYLRLPEAAMHAAAAEIGPRRAPRAGVVWAAGSWNPHRSIPVGELASLFQHSGWEFWNLQGGEYRTLRHERSLAALRDAKACNQGILPLAAVISQLDLVITVDTLAAHLAGAMDVPAWLMLQYAGDWRWMADRSDSPWYPSLRIFRQESAGDWRGVVEAVKNALEEQRSQTEGRAA
jgi:hypothetical protein